MVISKAAGSPDEAELRHHRTRTGRRPSENGRNVAGAGGAPLPISARPAVKHALALSAVIAVTLLAYANSFHAPFLLDSEGAILEDARIQAPTPEHVQRILTEQYWQISNTGLYRPLTTLSYLFNYAVLGNGTDPLGYHWLNFILHALNIVLVYGLGLALFDRIPAATLLSALWALHPCSPNP